MKKNKMMRIAAVLLVVTLLSTCAISGTFAKYVTKASVADDARVAKWGIQIETGGALFGDAYKATDPAYVAAGGTVSVKADEQVVAPGTGSKNIATVDGVEANGFYAKVSGKPEVATRFALTIDLDELEDVFLPVGTYTDYTNEFDGGQFELKSLNSTYIKGYSPVKWDIAIYRANEDGEKVESSKETLSDIAYQVANGMHRPELYDAFFTADGISLTDAKALVEKVGTSSYKALLNQAIGSFVGPGTSHPNVSVRNLDIAIDAAENTITLSLDFDPNQNLNYIIEGNWNWAFEQEATVVNSLEVFNAADTYLGNVAAEIVDPVPADVSTQISFNLNASATQID